MTTYSASYHPRIHYGESTGRDEGLGIILTPRVHYDHESDTNTQAWLAYSERETQERIAATARRTARRGVWRRRIARTLCALLAMGLLIFGFSDLINNDVDVARHGMPLAALVAGGGVFVALIFALTED